MSILEDRTKGGVFTTYHRREDTMTEETKEVKENKDTKEPKQARAKVPTQEENLVESLANKVKHLELALSEVQTQLIKLGRGFGRTIKLEHRIGD